MVHPLNRLRNENVLERLDRLESVLEAAAAADVELEEAPDSGNPTSRPEPAPAEKTLESAELPKPALEGSDKEQERKPRKRKPESVDPLGLVPDPEED